MTVLLPIPRPQYTDGNGAPLVGGSVGYYQQNTGGATLKAVWADEAQTIPLQNPVPLDAAGMTFSGGSQVSVWGTGAYEVFVRDSSGVLMYSALIDTAAGPTGDLTGPVTILGDLTVTGTTHTQDLQAASATIGDLHATTVTAPNAGITNLTVTNETATGGLAVNGALTVGGNANISGALGVNGPTNTTGLTNAGAIHTNTLSADSISAGSITLTSGSAPLTIRAGQITTDVGGSGTIVFSPAFGGTPVSLVLTFLSGLARNSIPAIGTVGPGSAAITSFDPSGAAPQGQATFYWIAVGP